MALPGRMPYSYRQVYALFFFANDIYKNLYYAQGPSIILF